MSREPEGEGPREERRQQRIRVLDLSSVGLVFPVALLLGYFAGRAIGGFFGSPRLGAMIGALLGLVGGFYNLFKMVSRLAPRSAASPNGEPLSQPPAGPSVGGAGAGGAVSGGSWLDEDDPAEEAPEGPDDSGPPDDW